MSISQQIEGLVVSRNLIRNKMRAAGQAGSSDKLVTLATNLNIIDTSDANATENDILTGKTAYVNGTKITGIATPGIDTSDATAVASDITEGKTAYVNGSKITGTSTKTDTSDATLSSNANLLSGNTAYAKGVKYTGSMVDQGTKTASLNCGESYTIPGGKHSGSGKVTANSLSSQTGVDSGKTAITAASVRTGYQGWVNGTKISGTMASYSDSPQYINPGGSYYINQGYHSGGYVYANSYTPSKSETLLWTNTTPNTSKSNISIQFERQIWNYEFDYFKFLILPDVSLSVDSEDNLQICLFPMADGKSKSFAIGSYYGEDYTIRQMYIATQGSTGSYYQLSKYTIGNGKTDQGVSTSFTNTPGRCIPYKVFGVKIS